MEIIDSIVYFLRHALRHSMMSAIIGSIVGGLMTWYIVSWDRAKNNEENRVANFRRSVSELKGQYHALEYVIAEVEEYKLTQKILICDAENRNYKSTFAPLYTLDYIKNQSFLINQLTIRRIEIESNIDRLMTYLTPSMKSEKAIPQNLDLAPLGARFESFNGDSVCTMSFKEQQHFQKNFRDFIDPKVKRFLSPLYKTISDIELNGPDR